MTFVKHNLQAMKARQLIASQKRLGSIYIEGTFSKTKIFLAIIKQNNNMYKIVENYS